MTGDPSDDRDTGLDAPDATGTTTVAAPGGDTARRLATLLAHLPGMAYRCRDDEAWTMEIVSEGCLALTGHPGDALIGNREVSYAALIHPDDRGRVRDEITASLARGESFELTYRIVCADGTTKTVRERGQGVCDRDGALEAIEGFVQDISQHARAEEQLRRSEALLREAQRAASLGSWEWDPSTDVVICSEETYRLFGLPGSGEAITGRHFIARVHPDDRARVEALLRDEGPGTAEAVSFTYRIVLPDGRTRTLETRASVLRDESGAITRMVGVDQDITDRRAAEDALAEREEHLRFVAEASALLGRSLDLDQLLDAIARLAVQRLGDACMIDLLGGEGLVRRIGASRVTPAQRATLEEFIAHSRPLEGDPPSLLRRVLESGEALLIPEVGDEMFARFASREARLTALLREAGLRSLLVVPLVVRGAVTGALTFGTLAGERRFGERDLELARALAERAAVAIENARLYAAARAELAERERAERESAASEARLQGFFDVPGVYFAIFDITEDGSDFVYLRANPAFAAVYGMTPDEMEGKRGRDLGLTPERIAWFVDLLRRCRESGEPVSMEMTPSTAVRPLTVLASLNRIGDDADGRSPLAYVATDITERKQLEAQFLQAQKMEAVGRLAGGVAHDFNNLLTVIGGSAEFLLASTREDDPARVDVFEIKRAAERAAGLTRQLLAFSRRQVVRPHDVDVNLVVRDAETMLRRLIGEDVDLRTTLAPAGPWVRIDPGQLEQALVNLAVNARDAMPAGGVLTIAISRTTLDASSTLVRADLVPGDYAVIAVSDTGVGMDEATRARIFEPFFTTKPPGQGTGLGLSTVFGIVTQANGHVLVYSEPGLGTTVKLLLPLVPDAPREEPGDVGCAVTGGTEAVLLVEDEPRVRRFTRRALEELGYTVLEASNGREALERADAFAGAIDLVLTDVVLPGRNGREVVEALEARRPGVRALFMSGYTADALLHHRIAERDARFLEKPYTSEELARAVREAMEG